MSPEQLQSFFALAIGFAFAGMLTTGFELATSRPLSFRLLQRGPRPSAFAAVPVLAFAAPFIIMQSTIRGCRIGVGRFEAAMTATVIAGLWSLMSGTVCMMAFAAFAI
jgi:O-antigen/teichoic acid export membrane protein